MSSIVFEQDKYRAEIWSITYCKVSNDSGDPLCDDEGNVIKFKTDGDGELIEDLNNDGIVDEIDADSLEEVTDE